MGCSSSVSAMTSLPNKDDSTSTTGFTVQQKRHVLKTWKILSNDLNGRGTRIFLRIFRLHPEVKKIFPCGHLEGDDLLKDVVFKGHASRFMQAVGAVIDNIDNYEKALSPLLNSLGRQHIHYKGFTYDKFDAFEEAMLFVWAEDLGSKFDDETKESWHQVFGFVMNELKQGYVDALKDAGLERPPWQEDEMHEETSSKSSSSVDESGNTEKN